MRVPIVSITLLGVAVGLHTTIFTAVDAMLLRPLPFPDPERLVVISERKPTTNVDELSTFGNYQDLTRSAPPLAAFGAYASSDAALFAGDAPQSFETLRVTSSLFRVIGTGPARGRLFTSEEETSNAPVAILTDRAWTRVFGRLDQIVGSKIDLDGITHTIIGVASPEAGRLLAADVLRPLAPPATGRGERVLHLFGRLADGVTIAAARTAMSQLVAGLEHVSGQNQDVRAATVVSLQDRLVAGVRPPMLALELLAIFIIILVSVNLVGLQFTRLEWRARDLAIRAALGASGGRLIAESLFSSLTIAVPALAVGLLTAYVMLAIGKATLITPGVLRLPPLHLDARAAIAATVVALVAGVGSGMCSVLLLLARDVTPLLHRMSPSIGPGRLTQRAQAVVVITQTALALIFVIAAFTLIGEVARQLRLDPGFRTEALWTVDIKTVGGAHVQHGVQPRQYADMLEALRALAGVRAAGAISSFPLLGLPGSQSLRVRAVMVPGGERVQFRLVMPGYFDAMGIPIRQGRDFAVSDDRSKGTAALVAIVNRAFVDRYWPGANPLGREVAIATSPWIHAIGVVDNVRSIDLDQAPVPELYLSPLQVTSSGEMTIALRMQADAALTASAVRAAIERVTPGVAVTRIGALDALLANQRRPQRLSAAFLSVLAMLAMGLAAAGTYSLIACAVASRSREIAIRRVLGAEEAQIRWRIASRAGIVVLAGIGCGLGVMSLLARVYRSVLPGAHTIDPLIVASAAIVVVAVSLTASYLPVHRAIDRPLREVLLSD